MKIHILHLCHRILPFHSVVERTGYLLDSRFAALLQYFRGFPLRKDIGRVGKIPFLQRLAVTHKESTPLHSSRQTVLRKFPQHPAHRKRNPVKRRVLQRLAVDIIAAKEFVRSLSGEHHLHFF